MDLFERIEKTRLLGREFLLWLWWKSELFEGQMEIPGFGLSEVWLDDSLTLERQAEGEALEQTKLRGSSPSTSTEAHEALRRGKVPTKARLAITVDEKDYSFVLEGETFALSGVRTPALLQDEREERFFERMYLLEELEEIIRELYREFLELHISQAWESTLAPAIRAWVADEPTLTRDEYLELVAQAVRPKKGRAKKAKPSKYRARPPSV